MKKLLKSAICFWHLYLHSTNLLCWVFLQGVNNTNTNTNTTLTNTSKHLNGRFTFLLRRENNLIQDPTCTRVQQRPNATKTQVNTNESIMFCPHRIHGATIWCMIRSATIGYMQLPRPEKVINIKSAPVPVQRPTYKRMHTTTTLLVNFIQPVQNATNDQNLSGLPPMKWTSSQIRSELCNIKSIKVTAFLLMTCHRHVRIAFT